MEKYRLPEQADAKEKPPLPKGPFLQVKIAGQTYELGSGFTVGDTVVRIAGFRPYHILRGGNYEVAFAVKLSDGRLMYPESVEVLTWQA